MTYTFEQVLEYVSDLPIDKWSREDDRIYASDKNIGFSLFPAVAREGQPQFRLEAADSATGMVFETYESPELSELYASKNVELARYQEQVKQDQIASGKRLMETALKQRNRKR